MNLMFWKKKPGTEAPPEQPAGQESATQAGGEETPGNDADLATAVARLRTKKRLMVGAAIGALLLIAGIATWQLLAHAPDKGAHGAAPVKEQTPKPNPPADAEMAQKLEALQKKNAELAAQVEALRKEKHTPEVAAPPPPEPAPTSETPAASDTERELVISNKDPKASAQALKRMIEEMNAASGSPPSKRPKPHSEADKGEPAK